MTASFVEVPGGRLETLDLPGRGPSPELLLLHEGLGSVSMWRDFPARLAERTGARVIAYSRHGFGRSAPRTWPYAVRFMHEEAEETIPALRRAMGIERPLLVGHSTGASMALLHAAADRRGVVGVVALAPLVYVEDSNLASIAAAREHYGKKSDWRDKLSRHHDDVDAVFRGWNDTWLDPRFRTWTITPDLHAIRCPILAILGDQDPYSTAAQLDAIARHAVNAQRFERLGLEGCGHAPHRDAPVEVLGAIVRFARLCASENGKSHFER